MIEDYFRRVDTLITETRIVHSSSLTYDKRGTYVGFIRGEIYFLDGSCLHMREFVNTEQGVDRYTYVYHYQRSDGALVFRYDNAPHFPGISTYPHHKHEGNEINVTSAAQPDLATVLAEIQRILAA